MKLKFSLCTSWHSVKLLAKKAIFQPEKEFSFTFFTCLNGHQRHHNAKWKRCAILELIWSKKEFCCNVTAIKLQNIFESTHATFLKKLLNQKSKFIVVKKSSFRRKNIFAVSSHFAFLSIYSNITNKMNIAEYFLCNWCFILI